MRVALRAGRARPGINHESHAGNGSVLDHLEAPCGSNPRHCREHRTVLPCQRRCRDRPTGPAANGSRRSGPGTASLPSGGGRSVFKTANGGRSSGPGDSSGSAPPRLIVPPNRKPGASRRPRRRRPVPRIVEPTLGVALWRSTSARVRPANPWPLAGQPVAVDDPTRDRPRRPSPLEGESGSVREVPLGAREPRPSWRGRTLGGPLDAELAGFPHLFRVSNEPSCRSGSRVALDLAVRGSPVVLFCWTRSWTLTGIPPSGASPGPRHATGDGEQPASGRSRPSMAPSPARSWSGPVGLPVPLPGGDRPRSSRPALEDEASVSAAVRVDAPATGAAPSVTSHEAWIGCAGDGLASLVDDLPLGRKRGGDGLPRRQRR